MRNKETNAVGVDAGDRSMGNENRDAALLDVRDLCVRFPIKKQGFFGGDAVWLYAVDGVSLSLAPGETLGLVGESGCGKSTLARAVVRLETPCAGEMYFEGAPLHTLKGWPLRRIRPRLQMIFQDPYASLNPRMTVSDALAEPLLRHGGVNRADLSGAVAALMQRVGLSPRQMRRYPHEFSGGQRQRVAIARALATNPRLVLADEPVSALDVSVQAQIINLLREIQAEMGLAMLFISHDLAVVRHLARRVAVMYLGRLVEEGPAEQVLRAPRHPYTRALINAASVPDPRREKARTRVVLHGDLPSPLSPPMGCPFHPRCPHAQAACRETRPELRDCGEGRRAACLRLEEIAQEKN